MINTRQLTRPSPSDANLITIFSVPIMDVLASSGQWNEILGKGRKLQQRGKISILDVDAESSVNPNTLLMVDVPSIVKSFTEFVIVKILLKLFKNIFQLLPKSVLNSKINVFAV